MKHLVAFALFYILLMFACAGLILFLDDGKPATPDAQLMKLCREYADRNHNGELAPERLKWFQDQGIDINTDFDWYQSCIDHNTTSTWRKNND